MTGASSPGAPALVKSPESPKDERGSGFVPIEVAPMAHGQGTSPESPKDETGPESIQPEVVSMTHGQGTVVESDVSQPVLYLFFAC